MAKEKCENHDDCTQQLAKHETLLNQYGKWMEKLDENIAELRDKLVSRPSWVVTILLTLLSTVSASLIVYIVTNVGAK